MKKSDLKILEKAFVAEISNTHFQSKSKATKKLIEDNYLIEIVDISTDRFCLLTIKHIRLTGKGHYIYCSSCEGKI